MVELFPPHPLVEGDAAKALRVSRYIAEEDERRHVRFSVGREDYDLMPGDFCLVRQGERFSYVNLSSESATLLLVHTPSFDLGAEVMEV